jgi:hypothetical protein
MPTPTRRLLSSNFDLYWASGSVRRLLFPSRLRLPGRPDRSPPQGLALPYRTFDRVTRVDQGAIVENKRLSVSKAVARRRVPRLGAAARSDHTASAGHIYAIRSTLYATSAGRGRYRRCSGSAGKFRYFEPAGLSQAIAVRSHVEQIREPRAAPRRIDGLAGVILRRAREPASVCLPRDLLSRTCRWDAL